MPVQNKKIYIKYKINTQTTTTTKKEFGKEFEC
jgi:hypothetical protein